MRKIIIICISFVLLNNCTDEADVHTYTTLIMKLTFMVWEKEGVLGKAIE